MGSIAMFWLFLAHLIILQFCRIDANVPAIIVFGDSSVDSGNNNHIATILKSNFQPYGRDFNSGKPTGRFSNGRLASDFISEAFGSKKSIPAYLDTAYDIEEFATGVCFASAGTGYDNATSSVLSVIPLWKEVEYYKEYQEKLRTHLGTDKANEILREALYLISVGTNDFLENYYTVFPGRSSQFSVDQYQDFLSGIAGEFVREIYRLGARKISLGGLSPMGCFPLERTRRPLFGSFCNEVYNNVAMDFNQRLQELVMNLSKELAGIQLVLSNPYEIVNQMIQNPSPFGFEHVTTACCGTGMLQINYVCNRINPFTCSDATKYMFWDSIHPTEKTNGIVADFVVKNFLSHFL